ncbi:acyl-CoA thioester hydrolase [Halorubrum aquaticum]|uniref:Acyl-CoA thioester hydrolase n=1 Tax=Halorubrum aquaticum TaxID=387340 RepID=A0A1I2ZK11_9EURY|nr:acyl-CoA thioester hydrolase [Halorubrum aquaticum]
MSTYTTDVPVRFRDIDAMGHVNNAVYATYLEQARTDYFRDVLGADLSGVATVLASVSIQFRRPVELEDGAVTVEVDVPELGESSVPMAYEVRAGGETVAEAESVQVAVDDEGSSRPIPEEYREAIETYHGL